MESTTDKALTYDAAMAELERIVSEVQSPTCPVDKLCTLTRRAIELTRFCQERLSGTNRELSEMLDQLSEPQAAL
jgi:exodeoxyribonuclease VII small subunit